MKKEVSIRIDTRLFYLVFLLFICVLLWNNHQIGLWDEDEAAYAGFAMNMLDSSDWLTIQFDEAEIHRKTPLLFWSITWFYSIFGISEFVLRLPGVLSLIGCFLLIWKKSRQWLGEDGARLAAIIFSGSLFPLILSKIALTDTLLLFWGTLAFFSFVEIILQPNWRSRFWLWFALAMGVLTKGPVLLLILGGVFLLSILDSTFRYRVWREQPWFGVIIALIPFIIWAYASYNSDYSSYLASGSNLDFNSWWQQTDRGHKLFLLPFLWDWYILRRIGGSVLGQSGWPGYHILCIVLSHIFWIGLFAGLIKWCFQHFRSDKLTRIIVYWLVMSWLFWEFMSSKLPSYSLLSSPAISFLLVYQLSKKLDTYQIFNWVRRVNVILGICIGLGALIGLYYVDLSSLYSFVWVPISILVCSIIVFIFSKKWQHWLWPSIQSLVFILCLAAAAPSFFDSIAIHSTENVAQYVADVESSTEISHEIALYQLDLKQQKMSLYVYLKHKIGNYTKLNPQQVRSKLSTNKPLIIITSKEGMQSLHEFGLNKQKITYRSTDDQLNDHSFFILHR